MSMKPDLKEVLSVGDYICNATASAGQAAFLKPTQSSGRASGQGINDNAGEVVPTGSAGPASGAVFVGVFMDDVVNVDLTTAYIFRPKCTTQVVGDNVRLLKIGEFWTDQYNGSPTITDSAYPGVNSKFGTTGINSVPAVGKFVTYPQNGYVKIAVNVA